METFTLGQLIKERREAKGLTPEEVSTATRIKLAFLKAIEEDNYRLLPDEAYILRFLYDYATFLNLDWNEVMALFKQQTRRKEGRSFALGVDRKAYTFSLRKAVPSLVLLLFLISSVFVVLSLLQRPQERPVPQSGPVEKPLQEAQPGLPVTTEKREETSPQATLTPKQKETLPQAVPAPEQKVAPSQVAPTPKPTAVAPQATSPPQKPSPTKRPPAQHVLKARASEPTWIQLRIDGGEEKEVLLKPGDIAVWTAKETFILTVGNAGGVKLELDGTSLPKLGTSGQVIQNLVLPREVPRE